MSERASARETGREESGGSRCQEKQHDCVAIINKMASSSVKYNSSGGRVYGSQRLSEPGDQRPSILDEGNVDHYESTSRSEDQRAWDVFVEQPPPEFDFDDNTKFELILKFVKFIVYIVAFIVVLVCAVLSKGSLLLMTSLIKSNRTGISICNQGLPGLDRDKRYEAIFNITDPQRTAWIWCLFIMLITPELMTLFRSIRICTFKSYRRPAKSVFLLVSSQ